MESSLLMSRSDKQQYILQLMACKGSLTFEELAEKLGYTNVYTAQLFLLQARLNPEKEQLLKQLVPGIPDEILQEMKKAPNRRFDETIMQDPLMLRAVEAMQQNAEAIKLLVNEKLGDGIISSIDHFVKVKVVEKSPAEKRVVIEIDGKFLPFREQTTS